MFISIELLSKKNQVQTVSVYTFLLPLLLNRQVYLMIYVYALPARNQLTWRKILSYNAMHKFSLQFVCWNHSHARPVAPLRSRSLSAAHRGRDTLNKRQSNMQLVAALQNLSIIRRTLRSDGHFVATKNHEERGTSRVNGCALEPGGRYDASNLIYRGRRHRPVIVEGETRLESLASRAGSLACIAH